MTDEAPVTSTTASTVPFEPVSKKESVSTEPACETQEATNGTTPTNGNSHHDEPQSNPEVSLEVEAKKLFSQGMRSLAVRDYKSAVSYFEEATQIMDTVFGVSANECGDYYLKYGTALFELARIESGVLDGVVSAAAIKEEADGEDDAEEDEGEDEDGDAENEDDAEGDDADADADDKENEAAKDEPVSTENAQEKVDQGDTSQATKSDEKMSVDENTQPGSSQGPSTAASSSAVVEEDIVREPVASSSGGASSYAVPGTSSGTANEEDQKEAAEDAEPSNTEIAWEVLSTARDIFKRSLENEGSRVKLADALQTLAEISLEWENFEAASDLFQESLALKKEVLPEGDRSIAESYYHIGITFSFMNEIERANDCFRSAVQVIETKIANLKKTLESANETKEGILAEIKELETLLPDMAARIEDSRDQMINSVQVMQAVEEEESRESEAVAKLSPKKPVNNISHLVKRKRPVSPDPTTKNSSTPAADAPDSSSAKKLCPSNVTE